MPVGGTLAVINIAVRSIEGHRRMKQARRAGAAAVQ